MWTAENRALYDRSTSRYPSDVTDEEWALIEPHLPPDRRDVLDAILYILTTGCQWRQLLKDFPSKSTVKRYLLDWDYDGVLARIYHVLYTAAREAAGRKPEPTLAIIDSQSVKTAENLWTGCGTQVRICLNYGSR
ncbi:MAG: transposase [Pseudomonadota bacterium]